MINVRVQISDDFTENNIGIYSQLLTQNLCDNNCMLDVRFGDKNQICKAINYSAPIRTFLIGHNLAKKLNVKNNDIINCQHIKLKQIKHLVVHAPSYIQNPLPILEYKLMNKNIIYKDEIIEEKMFDEKYEFIIKKIVSEVGDVDCGLIYGNNIKSDITIEFTV